MKIDKFALSVVPVDFRQYIFAAYDNLRNRQIVFKFENGYGASVIFGPGTYGWEEGLFELAVLEFRGDNYRLTYKTEITNDVLGHLSSEDVEKYLHAIMALPNSGQLNFESYSEEEMIEDYYASLMDAEVCEKLSCGINPGLLDRAKKNRLIMKIIDDEFSRRGITPPWRKDEN